MNAVRSASSHASRGKNWLFSNPKGGVVNRFSTTIIVPLGGIIAYSPWGGGDGLASCAAAAGDRSPSARSGDDEGGGSMRAASLCRGAAMELSLRLGIWPVASGNDG